MHYTNKFLRISLLGIFMLNSFFTGELLAQDCKVLKESISGTYSGDCKKGLAHGNGTAEGQDTYTGEFKKGLSNGYGTYTWADGNIYKGEFKNGLMEGEGEMTVALEGMDGKVTTGFWEKDKYLGKFKESYDVHHHSAQVTSVRITQIKNPKENELNALFVTITERGGNVFDQTLGIDVSVGRHSETLQTSRATKINVVVFPYRAVLNHQGETVDVEFYREGAYNIVIDTNR